MWIESCPPKKMVQNVTLFGKRVAAVVRVMIHVLPPPDWRLPGAFYAFWV